MKQAPQGPDNLSNGVLLYFKSTSPNEFVFAHIVQGGGSGHLRCPQDVVHRTLVSVLEPMGHGHTPRKPLFAAPCFMAFAALT